LARYFLDTSAVAKLYRSELGSAFIDRIFSEPASQHLISRLTIVEMESVLALKVRTGEIDQQAVLDHFRSARQLLIKHGATEALRSLDALQLSIAIELRRAGLVAVFVAADQKLCRVAALEGFAVTNPEHPASIVI
jgi:predicted nucleic acid-binding protein